MKKLNESPFRNGKRVTYYSAIDELVTQSGDWSDDRTHVFKHRRDAKIYAKHQSAVTGRKMFLRETPYNVRKDVVK